MLKNIYLILYRFSGWASNLFTLFLAYLALKNKNMWQGKYKFLAIYFIFVAIVELFASVTTMLKINNHFLNYYFIPTTFSLLILYLSKQTKSKLVEGLAIFIIVAYIAFQIYQRLFEVINKPLDVLSSSIAFALLVVFCLRNLTILFKTKTLTKKLRLNPDFWFTATIFVIYFNFLCLGILQAVSFDSGNKNVWFMVSTSINFIRVFLLYGFYRGIKLLE